MVPFLHITTRIEGRKNDDLLQKMGFRGFPSFAVLDVEGEIIAKHNGARSAEAFQETLDQAAKFIDLQKRAAAGERGAIIELALMECQMGRIKLAECEARLSDVGELNDEQKATLAGLRVDGKIQEQLDKLNSDRSQATFEAAAKVFLGMLEAGEKPSGGMAKNVFTQVRAGHSMRTENAAEAEAIHEYLKQELKDTPKAQGFLDRLAGRIADLKAKAEEGDSDEEEDSESEIEEMD